MTEGANGQLNVTSNYDNSSTVITRPTAGTLITGFPVVGTQTSAEALQTFPWGGTVTGTGYVIPTGTQPSVFVSPDGRYAYSFATHYDESLKKYVSDGNITSIDTLNGTGVGIPTGTVPLRLVISSDSRYAYVYGNDGAVTVVDPIAGTAVQFRTDIVNTIVALSPDSRFVYVYSDGGPGSTNDRVGIIDPVSGRLTEFQIGIALKDVAISPDSRIAIAYGDSGTAVILNPTSGSATVIHTGIEPYTDVKFGSGSDYAFAYNTFTNYDYNVRSYASYVSIIDINAASANTIRTNNANGGWQDLVVSPDGKYAYASFWDNSRNTVAVIDARAGTSSVVVTASGTGTGSIGIGTAENFFLNKTELLLSPDGRHAFANFGGGTIAIIDAEASSAVTIDTHANLQNGKADDVYTNLVVTPDGRFAYAYSSYKYSSHTDSDAVMVIDAATGTAKTVHTGTEVEGLVTSADGRYAYAYGYNAAVAIIDPLAGTSIKTDAVSFGAPVLSADGRYAYVVPGGTRSSDAVLIINSSDGTVSTVNTGMRTVYTDWGGISQARIVLSTTGHYAYVTNYNIATVAVINTASQKVTLVNTNFPVSSLEVSADGDYVYAEALNSGVFRGATVINAISGTGAVIATSSANYLKVNSSGYISYVLESNQSGGNVYVVDATKVAFPAGSSIAPDYWIATLANKPISFDPRQNPFGQIVGTTITGFTQPANGTVSFKGSNLIYVPKTDFTGTDSFEYTVTDGTVMASGIATVKVNAVPIPSSFSAGPTGTGDLFTTLWEANDLQHGVYTQEILKDGRKSLIVYIAGTMGGFIGGDQAKIKNIPAAAGIVDEAQVAVIKAAMTYESEPILLVGYSQGGMDAQNIAANASKYGLADQIKAVVTYGSPLVQPDKYPSVHLEDWADTVPKVDLLTPTNWIAGVINSVVNQNVYAVPTSNDFDPAILGNVSSWGVHGVRSTYEDVGLLFDADRSSHWDTLRSALAGFLNGKVADD